MSREELEKRVKDVLKDRFEFTDIELRNDVTFQDLGLDSLHEIEILMDMEHEFNITITDDEWHPVKTIGDIVDLVEKKL